MLTFININSEIFIFIFPVSNLLISFDKMWSKNKLKLLTQFNMKADNE